MNLEPSQKIKREQNCKRRDPRFHGPRKVGQKRCEEEEKLNLQHDVFNMRRKSIGIEETSTVQINEIFKSIPEKK